MITHIRMKNFKSWKDRVEVKLAPLTGFFGTNSSGKSSLLQMLLLLKQTAKRSDAEEVIFFGDENSLVNLGDFREVIHGHDTAEPLGLEFGCKFEDFLNRRFLQGPNDYLSVDVLGFNFKTIIRQEERELNIETLCYRSAEFSLEKVPNESDIFFRGERIGAAEEIKNCYGIPASEESRLGKILERVSSLFEEMFDHVFYLGPTRKHPQRYYHWEGDFPETPGQWGGQTIDALLSARIDQRTTPYKGENVPIEEQISAWLQKMELAHAFEFARTGPRDDKNYEFRIQKGPKSIKVTLADIGYGITQFLPVLVLCYYVPIGSTLILEEPGTHLHPKAQADIADLLIEVVNERKLQILVESHSEHLLNRLQRRVAEEKIAADQTALYFCRNAEGISKIDRLDMDELGNITNWPPKFFGDEMGDLFAMTEAQRKRQKKKGG